MKRGSKSDGDVPEIFTISGITGTTSHFKGNSKLPRNSRETRESPLRWGGDSFSEEKYITQFDRSEFLFEKYVELQRPHNFKGNRQPYIIDPMASD